MLPSVLQELWDRRWQRSGQVLLILCGSYVGFMAVHKDISQRAGIGERSLHYYLQQLLERGYIVRRYPLTGTGVTARQVRYAIGDPLLRFWFRFIFPRLSQVIRLGPQAAFQQCVAPDLDAYFGRCFESLCREALAPLYDREGVTATFEIGEYWDKTTQIDVVGLRQDGWTDLGECQWGENATPGQIVDELLQRVPCYPNA